jgi:hypothetical protein
MAINQLNKAYLVVASAWAVHAISWFLPVVKLGDFICSVRGWEAFRTALSPIWPDQGVLTGPWYFLVLSVASSATTFLFIVGSPLAVWLGSLSVRRACAWVAITTFVVNSHWYVLSGSDRKELSVGYFLWWISFCLLAVGLFALSSNGKVSQYRQLTQSKAIC